MADHAVPQSELAPRSQKVFSPQIIEAGVHRLRTMGFFFWMVSLAYILLIWTVFPRDHELWQIHFPKYATTASGTLLFGLILWLVTFSKRLTNQQIIDAGLWLIFLFSFSASLFRHSHEFLPVMGWRSWAPTSTVLLLIGTMVPVKPQRVLIIGLAIAATDPLAMAMMVGIGWSKWPMPIQWLMIPFTPFVSALMAYACSRVVYDLGSKIREAEQMGSYRLSKKLGVGGMGEVWLANHNFLARPAAVKLIKHKSDDAENALALRRFELEAQATAKLRSPHTVEVYDFGISDGGSFYYVMEHLQGLSLERLIKRFGPLPPERAIFLLTQICESLAEAHADGLIHRDITPANIMVCRYALHHDFVKVLDFGLVKAFSKPGVTITQTSEMPSFHGTPDFCSPEHVTSGGESKMGPQSDLYSLGCVAVFMLTGEPLFKSGDLFKVLMSHMSEPPAPQSLRAPYTVPSQLDHAIMACLRKVPAERPESASALAAQLTAVPLDEPWTEQRAAAWWEVNQPETVREGESATLDQSLHLTKSLLRRPLTPTEETRG